MLPKLFEIDLNCNYKIVMYYNINDNKLALTKHKY